MQKIKQFLTEVKIEMKKVTWPSKKDTTSGTVAVIIFVLIVAFFLGIADIGLSHLIGSIIK